MKLSLLHRVLLGVESGVVSIVSENEAEQGQVTVCSECRKIIFGLHSEPVLHTTCKKNTQNQSSLEFVDYKTGKPLTVPVIFSENNFSEIRLDCSNEPGFRPQLGEVWFILKSHSYLYIGSMNRIDWDMLALRDDNDQAYQDAIHYDYDIPCYYEYPRLPLPLKP